ncbi:hypothetical protein TanjilG_29777 [Lupinus angustifolius]|uniref:Uncharacterized protein n=1 Tax=Lupinus angustifolius TaxID=3871 RepID=A0A394DMS4_LUPAN|nr:hypothetical protein TanjilG_29777 [Lupinus angustifolius]
MTAEDEEEAIGSVVHPFYSPLSIEAKEQWSRARATEAPPPSSNPVHMHIVFFVVPATLNPEVPDHLSGQPDPSLSMLLNSYNNLAGEGEGEGEEEKVDY